MPLFRLRSLNARSLFMATLIALVTLAITALGPQPVSVAQPPTDKATSTVTTDAQPGHRDDAMRDLQQDEASNNVRAYGHWGDLPEGYSNWTNHTNRLIPIYTFGITLSSLREQGSVYADPKRLSELAQHPSSNESLNLQATYYDQTDLYRLQKHAVEQGYNNIVMIVFDGMDWQTTRAAALYRNGADVYQSGRGSGLAFQDDFHVVTDFSSIVTSAAASGAKTDVDAQRVLSVKQSHYFGYDPRLGGRWAWSERAGDQYIEGRDRLRPHTVTDSASSATSMFSGIKTYNGSINYTVDGEQVTPLARELQSEQDFMVGLVTSVPVSHATPAAAYANNVARKDYQDIARDLLGLPSSAHRENPLSGVDVLLGAGWGDETKTEAQQGQNFANGNKYIHQADVEQVDLQNGGRYRVVQRQAGVDGSRSLLKAAQQAADNGDRLLGLFGNAAGHLPYSTADGNFNPADDQRKAETVTQADIDENPSLAEMTEAALTVLEQSVDGFWLLIEPGDVDWANHANNLDNSIGAVFEGEKAFKKVVQWADENETWDHTAIIITADHGHYLVIDKPEAIANAGK